jgi:hypothetical protein
MSAYGAIQNPIHHNPIPQHPVLHQAWEIICRVVVTFVGWTAGCALAGGFYGVVVAGVRYLHSGRTDTFAWMPQSLMMLGAIAGVVLACIALALRWSQSSQKAH